MHVIVVCLCLSLKQNSYGIDQDVYVTCMDLVIRYLGYQCCSNFMTFVYNVRYRNGRNCTDNLKQQRQMRTIIELTFTPRFAYSCLLFLTKNDLPKKKIQLTPRSKDTARVGVLTGAYLTENLGNYFFRSFPNL